MIHNTHMNRAVIIGAFVLLPLHAQALEYQGNLSLLYTDAPFQAAEAAGIGALTGLGAVQGYPDGSFRPNQTLNRAEFLKIVFLSHPQIRVSLSDVENCFPDVKAGDWFSRYVCLAQKRGIVKGYPDGFFRPENTVNYAEALAILGRLYGYTAWADPDAPWYQIYVQAATNHQTILPVSLPYDRPITRGQMARLAAAYRAEYEGELTAYREAEMSRYVRAVPQELPSGDVAVEPEPEPQPALPDLPARSRFLVLGERSGPIADGTFTPISGPARVRIAEVLLLDKVESLEALYLVDAEGNELATLSLDPFDEEDETWRAMLDASTALVLPARTASVLAVEAKMYYPPRGGYPYEMPKVQRFRLTVEATDGSGATVQLVAADAHFPRHQESFGRITAIENAAPESAALVAGAKKQVAAFSFHAASLSGATLAVEQLTFRVLATSGVHVSGWELGAEGSSLRHPCSVGNEGAVNCLVIPSTLGSLDGGMRTLELHGTVAVTGSDQSLQVLLESAGSLEEAGDVRWTDGTGHYTWVEMPEPLATGTVWMK